MSENKNILIISGGSVDYKWASEWLKNRKYDYVIAADRGLMHADKLGLKVDFILGDYDSVDTSVLDKYRKNTQTVTYPKEKDYTDTHIAVLRAIEKKPDAIDILGATGTRYDHAMTNIYIMKAALDQKINCTIYDPNNRIYLANHSFSIERKEQYGDYLSFVPMTEKVVITLENVKYPLDHYVLEQGLSICQSNEIIGEHARIRLDQGTVVVYETRDR